MLSGEEVGDIFLDGKAYDRQRVEHARKRGTVSTTCANLPIDTPGGGHVKLSDVAMSPFTPAQSVVYRENASRALRCQRQRRGS